MSNKKIIAVVGATGAQGGGLVRAILDDPDSPYAVRALTRNPESEKARALAQQGVEVVAADMDDVESLKRAFEGVYGIFAVTNFWDHFSPEREYEQARNLAEAARGSGAEHVVWSTLEDTRQWIPLDDERMPTLQGKYKVPHFDAKGEADAFFADLPTTYLLTSFYWDNLIHFGMGPQPGPDASYGIAFPTGDQRLPGIAAEDIGKAAYGIFKSGKSYVGKRVGIAGGFLTGEEMAKTIAEATGKDVRFNSISPDAYRGLGFPGADDLGNMFQMKRDFNEQYLSNRSLEETRRLNPNLLTFEQWVQKYAPSIPFPEPAGVG